jgi:hypothetical protein
MKPYASIVALAISVPKWLDSDSRGLNNVVRNSIQVAIDE